MNAIKQHIDYLFQALPDTAEIKRIKNDLYLNGLDRFEELRAEGRSESEALGTVIIEMGDRDDLLKGLEYDQETDLRNHSQNTLDDAVYLIDAYNIEGNKIGLGVILILIGAGLIPTLETFNMAEIGVMILLVFVAAAVGMFIFAGLRLESIEKTLQAEDHIFFLTAGDYEIVEDKYLDFQERNRYRIPLGVMLCIVSALPILYFAFLENDFLIQRYGVLLLMLAVGIAVFQFVKYGMNETAFEKVLNIGEYSQAERDFQQKIEPISSIYWIIVTIIYMTWSFLTMNWHYTWIIWPIAGVVWALITMVIKYLSDRNRY